MENAVVYRYSMGPDKEKVVLRICAIDVSNLSPGDESQIPRTTGLSEFKSPYEDPGPLPEGRPSHPLRFVMLVAGLPRVTGYSLKFA